MKMDTAVAPLATIEDLSDPEELDKEDQNETVIKVNFDGSSKRPTPRLRSISEGPLSDCAGRGVLEPMQSVSEVILANNAETENTSDSSDRMAKHHMVLVHMKPPKSQCVQTYVMTPVRRASCLSGESSGLFCRICHEGDGREELMSPCKCTGTMGLIHVSCIEKWLSQAGTSKCEICGFEYVTEKTPRSLIEWLRQPSRPNDKRNLYGDLACFVLLTPLAGVSTWLCLSGAVHYSKFEKTKWETAGLITLAVFLILIYVVWCMVASRYHVRVIKDWRQANQVVRIVPRNDSEERNAPTDHNNNFSSHCVAVSDECQAMVHSINSPNQNVSANHLDIDRHVYASQGSLARNLSAELLPNTPVAASSPVQMQGTAYPDILESSAVYMPSTSNYQSPKRIWFRNEEWQSHGTVSNGQSYVNEGSVKSAFDSNPMHKTVTCPSHLPCGRVTRLVGSMGESKSLPRSLFQTKESKDLLTRETYRRVRSSLSDSAVQGGRSNDRNDTAYFGVMRVVKETYV